MLSPGQYYKDVPTDLDGNLDYRQRLLEICRTEPQYRAAVMEMCRRDIMFFISAFVVQYNPKAKGKEGKRGPFIPWECQEAALLASPDRPYRFPLGDSVIVIEHGLLWCYEHDKTAVIEKSREMGASWLFLILQVWMCLFHDYIQVLNISRSADAVDCKSPNSLFWKIRFIHDYLPDWLKGAIKTQEMYFEYQRTKSYITGEASTGRSGVGGRASWIFIDEFPMIHSNDAVDLRERTANTADCRFFNGTHQGIDTEFYKLTQQPEIVKIQMHWTQHPKKCIGLYRASVRGELEPLDTTYQFTQDYPAQLDGKPEGGPYPGIRSIFYDKKVAEIGSTRGAAMELDINPMGSSSQFFEPMMIRRLILSPACTDPYWEGDLVLEKDQFRFSPCPRGPLKLWTNLDHEGKPPFGKYAAGADVSNGNGKTNSCFSIVNATTGEKVLEYATPFLQPYPFAERCVWLCRQFVDHNGTTTMFAWETPGPGSDLGVRVIELGYLRVYYRTNEMQPFKRGPADTPGWWSGNPEHKKLLLGDYNAALLNGQMANRSKEALGECVFFKWSDDGLKVYHSGEKDDKDPSGAGVNHGDRVIADALAWKMAKELGVTRRTKEQREAPQQIPLYSLAWFKAKAKTEQPYEEPYYVSHW